MKSLISSLPKTPKRLPFMSNELVSRVLTEVNNRLLGKKKWCPDETLEQIVLNKYTVMVLERDVRAK